MAAPTIAALAAELRLDVTDAGLIRAFDAAMAWARDTLALAVDDTLATLRPHNVEAVYAYARDMLKLPKSTFGYYDPGIEGEAIVGGAGDIGRRWQSQLRYGMAASSGMA